MADDDAQPGGRIRRRIFLGTLGTAGAVAGVSACTQSQRHDQPLSGSVDIVPDSAPTGAQRDSLQHFNPQQALTVEAIVGRLIPGDAQSPGAREAGAVFYIDHLLAHFTGYENPAYMQGPFAATYSGDQPPDDDDPAVVWVQADQLERYGRQSPFVPREIYRMGLARLDELARQRFGNDFVAISETQQDELLAAVEDAEADDVNGIFGELSASYFFQVVRTHTLEGFLSDPVYGGNRDMAGWRLVGFPGSRRSYTREDMFDENFDVTPQSMLDLPAFNADRSHGHGDVQVAVRTRPPNGPID